jgi:hypothetical protein
VRLGRRDRLERYVEADRQRGAGGRGGGDVVAGAEGGEVGAPGRVCLRSRARGWVGELVGWLGGWVVRWMGG